MKHKIGFNRLSRKASHRKSLIRNMVMSLLKYERITTTKAKALAIRVVAEKMITRAKLDSVHSRRIIAQKITDSAILAKLFTEIGPRFKQRPGGYTRILKLGQRVGDAAEMVILELVEKTESASDAKEVKAKEEKKPAAKVAKAEKAAKTDDAPKAEKPARAKKAAAVQA